MTRKAPSPPDLDEPGRRARWGRWVAKRAAALTFLVLPWSFVALLAPLHWALEDLDAFRFQMLVADGVLVVGWAALALTGRVPLRKTLPPLAASALALALCLQPLLPLWTAGPAGSPGGEPFTVFSANVHTGNRDREALLASIREERPHVVFLLEVDEAWMEALEALRPDYPVCAAADLDRGNFGLAAFSRVEGSRIAMEEFRTDAPYNPTFACVTLPFGDGEVHCFGVHALPPVSTPYARSNEAFFDALAKRIAERGERAVVAGDFNRTPWSPTFRRFQEAADLTHGREGRGYLATWPRGVFFLRIPIDHVLATRDLLVAGFRVLPAGGSDHNPVVATIDWNAR